MINEFELRPRVTYVIENTYARGKFLTIANQVSGLRNGSNVYLWNDMDSAYSQWQLECVDGNNVNVDAHINLGTYYSAMRHVHSGVSHKYDLQESLN